MPHTLLLADDSLTIQRVIELTFAGRDVAVVSVSDGDAAMRALSDAPPDIVLADIDMPGASGYDIARHVSQTPELRHVPVLLLSGAFEPVDEEKARAAGSEGVLTKPFEPEEVIRKVTALLSGSRATAEPAPTASRGDDVDDVVSSAAPDSESTARAVVTPMYPAPVTEPTPVPVGGAVDDYFEQLDRAFAERLSSPAKPAPMAVDPGPSQDEDPTRSRPLLASAFSALLDAEQADGDAAQLPAWVVPGAASDFEGPASDDALVERIARRVLEQLSDRLVRETVTALVSTTAERLVREEIERIKRDIK